MEGGIVQATMEGGIVQATMEGGIVQVTMEGGVDKANPLKSCKQILARDAPI
jgi:hypothetical protein